MMRLPTLALLFLCCALVQLAPSRAYADADSADGVSAEDSQVVQTIVGAPEEDEEGRAAPVQANQKELAESFAAYLSGKLDFEASQTLVAACRRAPSENPFCYSVLNHESLEERAKRPSSSATRSYASSIKLKFRRHKLTNWNEVRQASVAALLKAFGAASPKELQTVKKISLKSTQCPNNAAIAAAATLEDTLPSGVSYLHLAQLYEKGARCIQNSAADRESLLTRAGLFFFVSKNYVKAASAFERAAATPNSFSARPLYWLRRTQQASKKTKKAKATLTELQAKYPFSFHTLVALTASNQDPGEVLQRSERGHLTRSKSVPLANRLIEQVEILNRYGLEPAAKKVLDWAIAQSQGAEPELLIYLSDLRTEQGDYHGKISLLSDILYKNPALVARDTLELYFPKVYFPIFEKQSSRVDPYLLLAIARRESAFMIGAVSAANARGLLQVMPGTGRQLAESANLSDPATNVELGARYITDLLKKTNGQIHLALAAYNAGPNRLSTWSTRYLVDDPILFIDLIPFRETREYVASVLRNYYWYRRIHKGDEKISTKRLLELANFPGQGK